MKLITKKQIEMYSKKEIKKVLDNKNTEMLIEWVNKMKGMSKQLLSPIFFHKSHSKRDREVICYLLMNFFKGMKIERSGDDGVLIIF